MWEKILSWFRGGTTLTKMQAVQAVLSGRLSLKAAAAAAGISVTALTAEVEVARELTRALGRELAKKGGFALLPSAPAILAGVAIIGAVGVGITMYSNWGKPSSEPIIAGVIGDINARRASNDARRNVDDPVVQKKSSEPYGVFVGGQYNEVIVGQKSVILEATTSSLVGWGRDSSKKVKDTGATFEMVLGPFTTADDARQAFDKNKVPNSERIKPLAGGTCAKFNFDGKEHDIDNAFRLLE